MKVLIASSMLARLKGLAGDCASGKTIALVPCRDIHTFTMTCPIDVAFVSAAGSVLEVHRAVPPLRRLRNSGAALVLERIAQPGTWLAAGDEVELTVVPLEREREV